MSEVLVTGGTGQLGRLLVPRLLELGHTVRVLSRNANPDVPTAAKAFQGDLRTGEGLEDAAAEVDAIVHCASGTGTLRSLTYRSARKTDVEATARLLGDAKLTGQPHVYFISIVGIDRIPLGYYRAKLEAEHVIEASGLPYTILRTTQWHTLAWEVCERLSRSPLVIVPKGVRLQLLDPGEVATRFAALVDSGRRGHVEPMGGPVAIPMTEMFRPYLAAVKKRRTVVGVPVPIRTVRRYRAGYNLTLDHADGQITWEEWLSRHVPR